MTVPRELHTFSWFAAACVSFYGFASWIVVNGVWVELPVLVHTVPEGWGLPAYLSIVIQIANLGPLLYLPLTRLCRRINRTGFWWRCLQPPERLANYIILIVGLLSCILLAHFWDRTVQFTEEKSSSRSIGLLTLAFFASIVDCTSSITFTAYLSGLPEVYMGALQFGEGFSDLVPSTIALIQGVGGTPDCVNESTNGTIHVVPVYPPPRFSVAAFMYCLAALLFIAVVAFSLLDLSPYGLGKSVWRHYMSTVWVAGLSDKHENEPSDRNPIRTENSSLNEPREKAPVVHYRSDEPSRVGSSVNTDDAVIFRSPSSRLGIRLLTKEYLLPIFLLAYLSFLTYGLLPGFQIYSSASYNSLTYHLAVTLSGVVGAVATVLATYFVHRYKQKQTILATNDSSTPSSPDVSLGNHVTNWASPSYVRRSQLVWLLLAFIVSIPTAYVIFLASKSPEPPQLGGLGPALSVLSWITLRAVSVVLRTWLWLHLSSRSHEPAALRYAGLATQLGAALGAVLSFLLVVHYQLFQTKQPCL